ncbi:hypothetical protein [Streptomyces rishiriensis]|uniref:hypothetical protein n=1 Tax=Streptomyces rishiriensis TaxID=68264 RepID=UPI00131EDC86|nr:hypothetical protein [Streptomyces rishiriensis]
MRHPPPSHRSAAAAADALVGTSAVPMVPQQGATPRAVEHTVAGRRHNGIQGSVRVTDEHAEAGSGKPAPVRRRRRENHRAREAGPTHLLTERRQHPEPEPYPVASRAMVPRKGRPKRSDDPE